MHRGEISQPLIRTEPTAVGRCDQLWAVDSSAERWSHLDSDFWGTFLNLRLPRMLTQEVMLSAAKRLTNSRGFVGPNRPAQGLVESRALISLPTQRHHRRMHLAV